MVFDSDQIEPLDSFCPWLFEFIILEILGNLFWNFALISNGLNRIQSGILIF